MEAETRLTSDGGRGRGDGSSTVVPATRRLRRDLQRELGMAVVLITHDPEDVRVFGKQVLRMDAGHMMEDIAHA